MKKLWFPAFIVLLGILNIGQSLHFAINGDDWLALYRYNLYFNSFLSHFDIRNYSTASANYVFGYLMMGIISKLFSYNPYPYYLVALILRIATAFSFYFSVYSATKNKWMSYLSATFFSCMFAGIETTNWVSNMNTYLSIILLNLFIHFFNNQKNKIISLRTLFQSFVLMASFLVTPVRMHGLLFLIPAMLIFKFKKINKNNIASFLLILSIFMIPLLLIRIFTYPDSQSDYLKVISMKDGGIFSVLFNLITNLGFSSLPNILINQDASLKNLYTVAGGLTLLILSIYFLCIRSVYPLFARFGLLSLTLSISFLVIPGFINPTSVFPSDHRYLIIPGSWLMIAFSVFIVTLYYQKNNLSKSAAVLFALFIILINSFALQKYFNILSAKGRLASDSERIFNLINNKIVPTEDKTPLVFLFLSNDGFFLYNAVNFGFTPHMMTINKAFAKDPQQAPFAVDNIDSLKSVLADPDSSELKRYGYKPVKIPIGNVYSFYADQGQILDYTDQIREKLTNMNKNNKEI
ncbi:MAG: hypothetical protein Q7K55_00040 [Candidatus Levybacteria bacterium]|nr:hypothetical protein [Candidatus Levybacteria bacterium]